MKILDLFNEYNLSPEMTGGEMEQPRTEKDWNTMSRIYKAYIVSKDFGWIKWLVDNDKIEINNLSLKVFKNIFSGGGFVEVSDLEVLLMLLAISDTPTDDLISYLK